MRFLVVILALMASVSVAQALTHWGFDNVKLEIEPCGKPPIQPRRALLENEVCPKNCLMRFKGATTDFGPGPLVLPVKKNQKSTVELFVAQGKPSGFFEKVREAYSGNGGSIQIFSYAEHGGGSLKEVKVSPPSISFPGQPVEVEVAYKWSKDESTPDCTFNINWEIVDPASLG